MKKNYKNIIKYALIFLTIIFIAVRISIVETEKQNHINKCKQKVNSMIWNGKTMINYETCKHYLN